MIWQIFALFRYPQRSMCSIFLWWNLLLPKPERLQCSLLQGWYSLHCSFRLMMVRQTLHEPAQPEEQSELDKHFLADSSQLPFFLKISSYPVGPENSFQHRSLIMLPLTSPFSVWWSNGMLKYLQLKRSLKRSLVIFSSFLEVVANTAI